jgi:hypothetical protein
MKTYKYNIGDVVYVKYNSFKITGTVYARFIDRGLLTYTILTNRAYPVTDNGRVMFNTEFVTFQEDWLSQNRKVTFVYEKSRYDITRRRIEVQEETSGYICGLDLDDGYTFKKFLKGKIVGPIEAV